MTKPEQTIFNRTFSFITGLLFVCMLASVFVFAQSKFPTGSYTSGDFPITFSEDGNHSVSMNGEVAVKGTYVVKENVIEMTDQEGQFACTGVTGKYKWKVQDKALAFEKIEDECDGRAGALAQPWTKK